MLLVSDRSKILSNKERRVVRELNTLIVVVVALSFSNQLNAQDAKQWDGKLVQFGTMHEAIGQQQHQGRVQLDELVKRPHFYAVAALEGLAGEVTIYDGKMTVTGVNPDDQLNPITDVDHQQATMLVGAYVTSWTSIKVGKDISYKKFDQFISDSATAAGVDTSKPFVFSMKGEFSDLSLHVINGACPVHARMKEIDLPIAQQPFTKKFKKVEGTLVGVFAKDAVGKLTHPATSTHTHILYRDSKTGKEVTGHIEQIGVIKGSVVMLPK